MTPLVIVIKNREAQTAKLQSHKISPDCLQDKSSRRQLSAEIPGRGWQYFWVVLQLFSTYHNIPWNACYFATHKYLSQNIRALTLITALHNFIRLPQSSSFSFKDPHIDLKQLVLHRRGTSCIIYQEEQGNRRKGTIKASDWKRRATSNHRWKLVER